MKMIKIFNAIRNVLFTIAVVILLCAGACLILKIRPAVVMSGSMEPTLPVGSVVFIDEMAADEVEIGDAIAFRIGENYVTHRILDKKDGCYVTKGDANDSMDPWQIAPSQVEGKVIFSIPYVGYLFKFLSGKRGMIVAASLIICFILGSILERKNE